MDIFMKLVYQHMSIFHIKSSLSTTSRSRNSRLVEDEDDSVKSGLKGFKVNDYFVNKRDTVIIAVYF